MLQCYVPSSHTWCSGCWLLFLQFVLFVIFALFVLFLQFVLFVLFALFAVFVLFALVCWNLPFDMWEVGYKSVFRGVKPLSKL
jgi:hypothetical protein